MALPFFTASLAVTLIIIFRRGKKSDWETWYCFPDVTTAFLTIALYLIALYLFTLIETSHLQFLILIKDSLYLFTARTAILNFLMKQELIYSVSIKGDEDFLDFAIVTIIYSPLGYKEVDQTRNTFHFKK